MNTFNSIGIDIHIIVCLLRQQSKVPYSYKFWRVKFWRMTQILRFGEFNFGAQRLAHVLL